MAKKKIYGLSEDAFRRVKEATNRVLGSPTTGARHRRQAPVLSAHFERRWTGILTDPLIGGAAAGSDKGWTGSTDYSVARVVIDMIDGITIAPSKELPTDIGHEDETGSTVLCTRQNTGAVCALEGERVYGYIASSSIVDPEGGELYRTRYVVTSPTHHRVIGAVGTASSATLNKPGGTASEVVVNLPTQDYAGNPEAGTKMHINMYDLQIIALVCPEPE